MPQLILNQKLDKVAKHTGSIVSELGKIFINCSGENLTNIHQSIHELTVTVEPFHFDIVIALYPGSYALAFIDKELSHLRCVNGISFRNNTTIDSGQLI